MSEIKRYGVTRRWSDAVVAHGMGYFVEVPDEPGLPPAGQFKMLFEQVERRCLEIGTDIRHLVQVLIYLPYPEDLELFNALWDKWIPAGHAPVRACSHPPLAAPDYRAELIVTVAIPKRDSDKV